MSLDRRMILAGGAAAMMGAGQASAQATAVEPSDAERAAMNGVAEAAMRQFAIPGLSIAIAAGGKQVFAQGYGDADREAGEKVTPDSLFRIASVSKPITAVAIFTLIERGKLSLTERVFGRGAVLDVVYGDSYPRHVNQITVEHLLTHTSGGWPNDITDPMFSQKGKDHRQLIAWVLANQPPKLPPGNSYAYSNFGYCVLGRIVEKTSGESYQGFVRNHVLKRCGISGMRIAGNTKADRAPNEVAYHDDRDRPYEIDVARMDSHGGWIATASDLVRFLTHVDGFPTVPDILRPATIRLMTSTSSVRADYAMGWRVNRNNNWWHTGSLAGTTTLMVRTARGLCWAALTNGRSRGAGDYTEAIDRMMWDIVRKVPAWKA
ncbi:MAG: beta-lactamase family protein [Alphaproteobacteria bacterium]|nr:beta-lactamase family protein [Alphaproteobacteria bacterium]MCW5741699.1 beta-lactamase family protein [Alphaproteobacteria bacterium]